MGQNKLLKKVEKKLWLLKCRRNRRWPLEPRPRPLASFQPRGASAPAPIAPPDLCVVVTTHRRPESCARLIDALHASLQQAGLQNVFVLVVNDPSARDYAPVVDLLALRFPGCFAFQDASRWLGKKGRWSAFQQIFDMSAAIRARHTLFIEDDITFESRLVTDALALWNRIDDPDKTVLYLMSARDDEPRGRYVRFERRPNAANTWRLTQWFDLHAFLVDARFFQLLGWEVFAPPLLRWRFNPFTCSGTSEQFTRRLFGRGNIYQVVKTLVFHGNEPSVLNPEARALRPLDNRSDFVA